MKLKIKKNKTMSPKK